jgi:glucokinase
VAVDDAGRPVAEDRRATPSGGQAVLDTLVSMVDALGPASAVGLGVPGLVDTGGVLRFAPNLPGVVDLDVRGALLARFPDAGVQVDNDATCAGWAEGQVGAARGYADAILVTLGTGIGGGLIVNGEVARGAHGFGGEIGHMVVDPNGPRCPCGLRGCWERYASGSGLGWMAREAATASPSGRMTELAGGDPEAVRGEHATAAAAEGDAAAAAVLAVFGRWVALGLANLANVFDPDLFVLGGGLVEAGEILLAPVRDAFAGLVLAAAHRPPIPVVAASLGERAGAIGAALLAGATADRRLAAAAPAGDRPIAAPAGSSAPPDTAARRSGPEAAPGPLAP